MIRVYDDHVLITSPGLLPEGVTISDLSRDPHPSKLRNPLLAQAFYFASIVERWGSGTTRTAEQCALQRLPAPEFAQVGSELYVTFHKDLYTLEQLRKRGLSERQIKAVQYVREKESISNAEYRHLTGVSDRTALRDLDGLTEAGILTRAEIGRQSRYTFAGQNLPNPPQTRHKPATTP